MRTQHDLAANLPATAPIAGRVLDFRTLLAIIGQYVWLLIFCILAALGTARIVLNAAPAIYTASAEVMLNNRATNVLDVPGVLGAPGGHDLAASELRILTSQRLLQQVIERLHLDRDPEFNRALASPDEALWPARLKAFTGPILKIGGAPAPTPAAVTAARAELEVIERFRGAVRISAVPRTRSLTVSVSAHDPAKAALIANTLADLYIVDQLDAKFEATRHATAWLDQRLAELKTQVARSEAAASAYRARQSLGPGQGRELTAQQIAELNSELISARASLAEAQARAGQVERRIAKGGLNAAARVLSSELILTLRTGLATLIRREAELSTRYGPKHPRIKDIRAEIADSHAGIGREVRKIVEGLRNDVAVARARAAALERGLATLETKSVALSENAVHLHQLEREAKADREIYESFLTRVRQIREQTNLQSADARILSLAIPPLSPSGPNRRKIIIVALGLGLAIAVGLIVILEASARSIRAGAELTDAFGLPVLAILPRRGGLEGRKLLHRLGTRRDAGLTDAARELTTAAMLTGGPNPPRVIALTSSVAGEDAHATAVMLARAAGISGARTLLVDANLAHPRLARLLDRDNPGLVGLLDGTSQSVDLIVKDPQTGLDLLPVPRGADAAMTHGRLAHAIGRLRTEYDLIVLIGPPVLTTADAGLVGRVADQVLYAVRWHSTPESAVRQGLARLATFGVVPTAFVLTGTDKRREARHAFARFGTGYGTLAPGSTG